ncbi:SoxS protein [Paracoccus sp. S-4012]|uniref:SoxS protein n=1 Tax=Paracoccus sp. S-4012 TaxID=2665648 RepID=UPI0012B0C69A|nr:SoxS protein [Paracoccus sp. S-4012]MRX51592.1 SoxS protein [Paracoccus sp. S-4012]
MFRPALLAAALLAFPAAAEAPVDEGIRLLMLDRAGCIYCAQWKREILPAYARNPDGKAAPLAIVDIDGPFPDGLALDRMPVLTPTFVLLRDGIELGRIEGYAGRDFFWPMIGRLLDQGGVAVPGG